MDSETLPYVNDPDSFLQALYSQEVDGEEVSARANTELFFRKIVSEFILQTSLVFLFASLSHLIRSHRGCHYQSNGRYFQLSK